jgi:hypothetical protein
MTTFQRETLYDVIDEVGPLLEMHYQELTLNKDKIKLDPIWDRYVSLANSHLLEIYTARDEGKLVGYSAFFVQSHIHYSSTVVASNDVLFLHIDARKKPTVGIRLIKFCEQQLKDKGVHKITFHAKLTNELRTILNRMGYADEEIVVGKIL